MLTWLPGVTGCRWGAREAIYGSARWREKRKDAPSALRRGELPAGLAAGRRPTPARAAQPAPSTGCYATIIALPRGNLSTRRWKWYGARELLRVRPCRGGRNDYQQQLLRGGDDSVATNGMDASRAGVRCPRDQVDPHGPIEPHLVDAKSGDVRLRTEAPRCPVAVTSTWSIAPSPVRAWLDEHEGCPFRRSFHTV